MDLHKLQLLFIGCLAWRASLASRASDSVTDRILIKPVRLQCLPNAYWRPVISRIVSPALQIRDDWVSFSQQRGRPPTRYIHDQAPTIVPVQLRHQRCHHAIPLPFSVVQLADQLPWHFLGQVPGIPREETSLYESKITLSSRSSE